MKGSFLQQTDQSIRHLLPVVATTVLIFVGAVPLHIPDWAPVAPLLPLIAIYYWSIYRPDLMTGPIAFALGLLSDGVSGAPLGVSSLVYLFVQGLTVSQRRFFLGKSFLVGWFGFALVGGGAILAQWLLMAMVYGRFAGNRVVMAELAMTLLFYPLLSWGLTRAQIFVLREI
jgi:rod shape-determining protein MreD